MADQDSPNSNNGSGPENAPQIGVLTQYVKDLSVESPNSPAVFQWETQPQVDVQFGINAEKVSDEVHEVTLKVNVGARSDNGVHFLIDLSYAGLFGLRNLPEDTMGPFLLVEAPRLLFPLVRQVIAESVQNVGFPPLLLEPIDFGAVFMQQLAQQPGEGSGNGAGEPAADETPPADGDNQG
jgi:preprotein translocase subunit SecB